MAPDRWQSPWAGGEIARAVPAPAQRPPRQITQITSDDRALYALCNDGTVWQLLGDMWLPEPPIPQRQLAED